ncbi:hypothetical protein GCM10025771_21570 [Niveibacterium umoris]|uniref:DUF4168 domain-containing protein n=1 Tax=Niveibacterium umoris TaxID=1193620 RepID=A0A840BJ44_9RHOO|nr:hypothetical protein [Niveibacterium umoris]MBB4012653.1 hypothetical protein [Niveibacterium umoris]
MQKFRLASLALIALLAAVAAQAAEVPPEAPFTPAQAAYFKAETRKADDRFVSDVARITGSTEAAIRKAMPPEGRIANPAVRVVTTLEHQRGAEFSEEIRARVDAAEAERRKAVAAARDAARKR